MANKADLPLVCANRKQISANTAMGKDPVEGCHSSKCPSWFPSVIPNHTVVPLSISEQRMTRYVPCTTWYAPTHNVLFSSVLLLSYDLPP